MATGDCGICAQLIDCGTVPVGNNFNRVVAAALCQIAEGGGGGGGSGVVVVETCLLVTEAATGISPGDVINMLQFFDTTVEPYVLTATIYFNVTTRELVTSVDDTNSEPCPQESLGTDCTNPIYNSPCFNPDAPGQPSLLTLFDTHTAEVGTDDDTIVSAFIGDGPKAGWILRTSLNQAICAEHVITEVVDINTITFAPPLVGMGPGEIIEVFLPTNPSASGSAFLNLAKCGVQEFSIVEDRTFRGPAPVSQNLVMSGGGASVAVATQHRKLGIIVSGTWTGSISVNVGFAVGSPPTPISVAFLDLATGAVVTAITANGIYQVSTEVFEYVAFITVGGGSGTAVIDTRGGDGGGSGNGTGAINDPDTYPIG